MTDCLVRDCWVDGEWRLDLCRSFGPEEVRQWETLLHYLDEENLTDSNDGVLWALEKRGVIQASLCISFSLSGV